MKDNFRRLIRQIAVLLIAALVCRVLIAEAQEQKPTSEQLQQASQIERRNGNGIVVDNPKVYDDSSLQLMLNSARARLAAIQAIDQTGLLSRIGAVTGASLDQSALGVTVSGPPIPQSVVTANGATRQTTTSTASGGSTQVISNLPVQNTVTTNPLQSAAAPAQPANGGVSLPSNTSVSALDALNEQMQLTYEIANLQLLLEGSLNDRYVKGTRFIKPRTTLGFPITIWSQAAYKNAVAVVEVEVQNPTINFNPDDRPAVTALLPREKTYNVAALTDHMTSIGAGLVSQVISGGFSFLRGRKSYYVVQDQDTLAMMERPSVKNAAAFSWQFRPVLGQAFVRAGMKQTFVQLSAPLKADSGCFGKIKVRTYWRRIDRKTGVLKEVIPESISNAEIEPEIPVFDLAPVIEDVSYDDLGAGQLRVSVAGKFLGGTYIRIGNIYCRDGSPGFTSELTQIRFVATAADIAKYRAYVVSRDGSEIEIIHPLGAAVRPKLSQTCIADATSEERFRLDIGVSERTISPGQKARFAATITTAADFNQPVTLSGTGFPTPTGGQTGWSAALVTPAPGSAVKSTFTVDTTAATTPGDYTIQLAGTAGTLWKTVNAIVHVVAPVIKPTITATISTYDDSKSIVKAIAANLPSDPDVQEYLIVINDRVFGLADALIERDAANRTFRAIVPTSVLNGPTTVQLRPLFWADMYSSDPIALATAGLENATDKVVVLDQTADPVVFLLYGSRLTATSIIVPSGVTLNPLSDIDPSTLGKFTLAKAQWTGLKQIVLRKTTTERPVFVALPTVEGPPKITLTVGGRVAAGTDELTVTGDNFDNLRSVLFNKLPIKKVASGKTVRLLGLVAADVTRVAGEPELQFEFEDGKKNTLKLEVVTSKVETVSRDKP